MLEPATGMEIVPIVLFAVSATFTPGPNNALVMGSAFNFGVRRSMPLWLGMCLGFPALILTASAAFGTIVHYIPKVYIYLKIVGAVYLLYLAYKIFSIRRIGSAGPIGAPLGFLQGAAFQWVNPKSWIVAVSATSSFAIASKTTFENALILSSVFICISLPCVGTWMVAGNSMRGVLNTEARVLWFNRTMALLLVASVVQTLFFVE